MLQTIKKVDVVITFVDGTDPAWIKEYNDRFEGRPVAKRYRDWGTLKYLLRAIEKHMPFIRKVFLVVSSSSQVPSWIDTDTVNVVLHEEIIPKQYLPTFNSSMIEMFLHRIPDLSEQYIYFNDDMFPVRDCREENFFIGGLPTMGMSRHLIAGSAFLRLTKRSDNLARKAAKVDKSLFFIRPQHTCSPMLKTECEKLYNSVLPEIIRSLSPLRAETNYNQYLFLDYMYFTGKLIDRPISRKHYSLAIASLDKIAEFLHSPDRMIVCINDVEMSDYQFLEKKIKLLEAFKECYHDISVYERHAKD